MREAEQKGKGWKEEKLWQEVSRIRDEGSARLLLSLDKVRKGREFVMTGHKPPLYDNQDYFLNLTSLSVNCRRRLWPTRINEDVIIYVARFIREAQ